MAIEEAGTTYNGLCHAGRARLDAHDGDIAEDRKAIAANHTAILGLYEKMERGFESTRKQNNWILLALITNLAAACLYLWQINATRQILDGI